MEIIKKHLLLAPGGEEYPIILPGEGKGRDPLTLLESLGDEALRSYVLAEEIKTGPGEEPPSTYYMRKLELVDYEPAADNGKMLMTQEELISHIREKCDDMPWKELWLDKRCSRQPVFRG